MTHPTQVSVARSRCRPSCDGKKFTSHTIVFIYNIGNSGPIYANTLYRALPRIGKNTGFNAQDFTDFAAGTGYNIGFAIISTGLIALIVGNQIAYQDKLHSALFNVTCIVAIATHNLVA